MKRVLCCLLSALMLLQLPFAMAAGASGVPTVLYEDDFSYDGFAALYDSAKTWENEHLIRTDEDYGVHTMEAPAVENGVIKFNKGDGLRLNWTQIKGISAFDATKTYTITFDVKVTDFGVDTQYHSSVSNREFYFAPGGYYNQIEMRNANHNNLGIRAGGTWNNDLTKYTLNTVYSCTVVWSPADKKITSTVKNGTTVVATGSRTSNDYATYNKYTRSFIWRCEDGACEVSNITFSDGSVAYTAPLYKNAMNKSGLWELEAYASLKSTAKEPILADGVAKLTDQNTISFNWLKVSDLPAYEATNTYIYEYDVKLVNSGDGSVWGSANTRTRAMYVAFGGWYDLIQLPSSDGKVVIGGSSDTYTDEKYLGKDLHVKMMLQGTTLTAEITDKDGNVLISGSRTKAEFAEMDDTHMRNVAIRCEDGEIHVDNFKFSIINNAAVSVMPLEISDGKQAIYECDVNYDGKSAVRIQLGTANIFVLDNNTLYVGGKQIAGSYGQGTYKMKAWINPAQEMVTVEAAAPDGAVARRGCYTLLGGKSISVYADENVVANASLVYDDITVNDYTLVEAEPTYNGFNANVYNLVISFTDAAADRAFAWTAKADYIGSDAMVLKYRAAGETKWVSVDAVPETDNEATEEYFKCDIDGLTADTTYEYKIGKKDSADEANDWSKLYTFKTAKAEIGDFKFIAVGDTQGKTWGGVTTSDKGFMFTKAAIDEALEETPDAAFLLHTGDIVEYGNYISHWNYYFKALGDHASSLPHFAALGNHDALGGGKNFDLHLNHPNNGGTAALDSEQIANITTNPNLIEIAQNNADETIYSYNYGEAHFVVLNTGAYHAEDGYILEAQRQWLIDDLEANKDAKWTIMMFHQPIYHRNGGSYDRPQLYDVIEGYGVDLVLAGHSHLSTRTYPMKNGEIVTKLNPDVIEQGTGTVYATIGSTALNHDGAGDTINEEEIYHMSIPTSTQPAYSTVEVKNNALHVVIKQVNGLIIDEFTINAAGEATVGEKVYDTLEDALDEAVAGDVVKLKENASTDFITVDPEVTLDLNGKTLTAGYVIGFKGSVIGGEGKLIVNKDKVSLDQTNGGYLPVCEDGGYIFVNVNLENRTAVIAEKKFAFSPAFDTDAHEALLAGYAASGVQVVIRLNWEKANNYEAVQDFTYVDEMVTKVIGSYDDSKGNYGSMFIAEFAGSEAGGADSVSVSAVIISDTGVEIQSAVTEF